MTVSDPAEAVAPGTVVGGYVIDRPIGEGGMGIVYGAVHPVIGKRAAIKVLNTRFCADHEALRRFVHEAQAVNTIGHANIVDIFSIGDLGDGRSYLVMEWLQGETLMDRLAREPLPIADVVAILVALTRALEAAHNAGVVHRDLKPENVFLVREDEGFRTKLLDFGIAKLETRRTHPRKTATGMTVGTPLFMSPEQAKGSEIDGKSDVYSLGVLAYAMVCRRTPFEHEPSSVEVLHAHISQPPRPPRELVSDVPAELDALILHMLAKAPGERPTMAEIRRRLRSLDHGGFETFTAETRAPLAKVPEPRSPLPLVVGAAVMFVAIGVFVFTREKPKPAPVAAGAPKPAVVKPPPPPVLRNGTLELVIEPVSASVTVDGQPVPLVNGRAHFDLAEGDHVIATYATGFRAGEQTVAVTSSTVSSVSIKLVKHPRTRTKAPPKDVDAVVDPFGRKKKQ